MRRLAGADSMFVFNETDARHQHTLKIAVVDPAGADQPVTFAALRDQLREALALLEPFRWQLVRVPFDLGLPYWVDAGTDIDLTYHLRHTVVAAPGGPRELAACIGTIASVGLDRDHPLWQVWFVEGLEHGHVAYVAKVHHALADGLSSAQLLSEIATADPTVTTLAEQPSVPAEAVPTRRALLRLGARDAGRAVAELPALLAQTRRFFAARRRRVRAGLPGSTKPFRGPGTRFDRPLSPQRSFAYASFPIEGLKDIGRAGDATLNDTVLALVSGALRRYLTARGDLPAASLTAAVPVSVREADEARAWGNRLASWYVDLATNVEDPLARLRSIAASTRASRRELTDTDPHMQHAWAEYQRLFRLATFGLPHLLRPLLRRPSYNLIVSTVPGPAVPVHRHGAQLVQMFSMGPLVEGMGINFTGWSYAGTMTIAVMACSTYAPDLWEITNDLHASHDELVAATSTSPTP